MNGAYFIFYHSKAKGKAVLTRGGGSSAGPRPLRLLPGLRNLAEGRRARVGRRQGALVALLVEGLQEVEAERLFHRQLEVSHSAGHGRAHVQVGERVHFGPRSFEGT
ncbi:hypothetical protein AVEN_252207-1 [Araneus ventricosus]|uniref:Uncharacterized protein n=1 Tax=Araneus ventricosus TaxID=182803 RepID=A0A4Y2BYT8_ARAVE|nr:hypothetical protein AVEN_252207-1 [Araneus ventricosus]